MRIGLARIQREMGGPRRLDRPTSAIQLNGLTPWAASWRTEIELALKGFTNQCTPIGLLFLGEYVQNLRVAFAAQNDEEFAVLFGSALRPGAIAPWAFVLCRG